MAFAPSIKTRTPASVASGWLDTTIPFLAKVLNFSGIEFLGHSINSSPVGHVEIQVNFPLERRSSFPLFGKKGQRRF
jgi:hypothetical protein